MPHRSIVSSLHSIRCRYSLLTGLMLLSLLLSVYLGGRYILVQMIRQTEENIRVVGNDIKRMVLDEAAPAPAADGG